MHDLSYDPDDVTTWKFIHMSPTAALASVALHAMAVLSLLPGVPPTRERHLSERAIAVTLELPSVAGAPQVPAVPGDEAAAHRQRPGWTGMEAIAVRPSKQLAVAVPLPAPSEPDPATILPSTEPPPVAGRPFGKMAPSMMGTMLPPAPASMMGTPPLITGRELGMSAPTGVAMAPLVKRLDAAPAPDHPVRQDRPMRAAQQQVAVRLPAMADLLAAEREALEDYVHRIVRLLSQHRFQANARDASQQGVVVVLLTVARDGRLLDLSLEYSSGLADLDRGVADAIRRAAPFPSLPDAFAGERHSFIVPIAFRRER